MTSTSPRRARVAQAIRENLAELIARDISDPRLARAGLCSVTHVDLNRDMSVATIYVSFLGGPEGSGAVATKALGGAAGRLRGPLGRALGMQNVPTLRFVHDDSGDFQARLSDILRDDERKRDGDDD